MKSLFGIKEIIALTICASGISSTVSAQSTAKKIDAFMAPLANAKHFSGVVLASENGRVVYEKAFGLANADFKIPNELNTRIGVASLTKGMTMVILGRLIDDGKIALTDKLNKFVPDFPNGDKITVGMLANHRSGIPHRVMKPEEETISYTSAEFVERVKQAKLIFEPGAQRLYSSAGYAVLARCLEIAAGKSYAKLLHEHVFIPAGMTDSVDFNGEAIMERRAQDYLLGPTGYVNAPLKDYSFLVGAGSVYSTARDIYRYAEAVLAGKYGQTARRFLVGQGVFWANGSTNGHRAYFRMDAEGKWGFVFLANLNSGATDLIQTGLESILTGRETSAPVVPRPVIVPNPNKDLSDFVGQYHREGGGGGLEITLKNETLFSGDIRFYPTKPDCFFEYRFYGDVCFVRNDSGKIKHIEWASPTARSNWLRAQ